jgi:hypothetical protein
MSDLYAYIHTALREDEVIKGLMGFSADAKLADKAQRIQKKRKPTGLVDGKFPIVSFYANPGIRDGSNHLVYMVTFDFDIYVQDGDEEVAIDIADRINEIFNDQYLGLKCGSSFKCEFLTMGEIETDDDQFKFFTQILFNIGIEG